MFDITTSHDFLMKLEADFDDFMKEPHSARLALNCALTAYHLCEWVWADWLKDQKVLQGSVLRKRDDFLKWIDTACPWFETIQELANGTKHLRHPSFTTERVGAPPFMLDELGAGFDEGNWDGPMPYVAEMHGEGCLLIDYGEGAGAHRWKTAAALLDAVVRFWRQFFATYHPDPKVKAGIREWRLS
jgi:hypothetical protein